MACSTTPQASDSEWDLLFKIANSAENITGGGGGGSAIAVKDEGVPLTAGVTSFDFVGGGVTATAVGNAVTVTVPAGGTGDVVGPASSVNNDVVTFNGVTGKLVKDSGILVTTLVVGPATAVSGDIAQFNGATGKIISDSGKLVADIVTGPAAAVNNDIATFNGVTGKLVKDSGIAISSIVTTSTLQSGSQAIGNGVDTISVTFGTAFASAPTVVASISRPVAENLIDFNIDEASITTTGFTASLGAATGSANYKLKWMAK